MIFSRLRLRGGRICALMATVASLGLSGRVKAQHLRIAEDVAPATLNPAYRSSMVETRVHELLFLGLFKDDRQLDPSPGLARKWRALEKGLALEVELGRHRWHDGRPVSAEDVAYTVEALQSAQVRSTERRKVDFIKSVEVMGPKKILIRFNEPLREPARRLTFKILPRHLFSKGLSRTHPFRVRPVGSGPFSFVRSMADGSGLSLKRASSESKGKRRSNRVSSIDLRYIEDKTRQLQTLQFGGVDAIVRVLPKHRAEILGLGTVELHPYDSLSWWYIGVNHRNPNLSNRLVRQAMLLVLDRDELRSTHLGDGTTISGPFAPRSPFYDLAIQPRNVALKKSAALMKKAGFKLIDGVYKKKGRSLSFDMVLSTSLDAYQDVCLDIQSRLRRAGFDVRLVWVDPAAFSDRVLQKGRFDLTIDSWTFDESSNVYPLFHSEGTRNYIGYENPKLDGLLDQSRKEKDPEKFLALYLSVHKITHEELPYLFLWSVRSYSAMSKELTGIDIHPFRYYTWVDAWRFRNAAQ